MKKSRSWGKKLLSAAVSLVLAAGLLPVMPATALAVAKDDAKSQVHVVVDNTVYPKADGAAWDGVLVDTWVDLNENSTMMNCVGAALAEVNATAEGLDSGYISSINGMEAGKPDYMSGYMGTLNDWFTNRGFSQFTVAKGSLAANDEIHIFFSKDGGVDHGGTWDNNDTAVKAITFSDGALDKAFDPETAAYTLTLPAGTESVMVVPTAANKNFQVRTSVGDTTYKRTESVPVSDGTVITVKCDDPSWPTMNNISGADFHAHTYTFTVAIEEQTGDFAGKGTQEKPYLLKSTADLTKLSENVAGGEKYEGVFFKMAADIELPAGWTPIGSATARFKGSIDGDNHLLTVPVDGLPLLGATEQASVSNLNIYGEKIAGYGLVNTYTTGSSRDCISIKNVTLKSGSSTLMSGFIGGYASSSHAVTIENCTIEEGVTIGYDGQQSNIGAFAGEFNGTIKNCVSHATVKGMNFVGGIVADKGQSMGTFIVDGCSFDGTVVATGNYVGGILGAGYAGTNWGMASAPNACFPTVTNCTMSGSVTGVARVGGIFGGEGAVYQCWNNGAGSISNNVVTGTVQGESETGAIIGFIAGLDKYNTIENNQYAFGSYDKGIGRIEWVDTSYATPAPVEGTTYLNSSVALPDFKAGTGSWDPKCFTAKNCNRTDDPLGVDADKLTKTVYPEYQASLAAASDKILRVGDTFTVTVTVSASAPLAGMNAGLAAMQATLDFDADTLEIASIQKGAGLSADATFLPEEGKSEALFSFLANTASAQDGIEVAKVTFKALKTTESCSVSLKDAFVTGPVEASEFPLEVTQPAQVSIIANALKGDANGNGRMNIVDAQVVYDLGNGKYGADYAQYVLPATWTHATLLWAADVNNDAAIDAVDAFAIQHAIHAGTMFDA